MLEETRASEGDKKGQSTLPLVLVPFEAVPEEEPAARRKQATKSKRLQALTVAQDMLYAVLGRLGLREGARREASASGAG